MYFLINLKIPVYNDIARSLHVYISKSIGIFPNFK